MSNPNLIPTPIVDKNGKQTTVHKRPDVVSDTNVKRVASVQASPVLPSSSLYVAPSARDENNGEIEDLVDEAEASGLLHRSKAMNGDRRYETGQLYVGRKQNGERVWVSLSLEHSNKPKTLTDGSEVDETWELSMTGVVKDRYTTLGAGQMIYEVLDVVSDSKMSGEDLNQLHWVWINHHLNGLIPGTEKQMERRNELASQGVDVSASNYGEYSKMIDDDNGYKYGSSWLIRDVPSKDIASVLEILGKADRSKTLRNY